MSRIASVFVRIFEYAIPDPYVFAVALTLLTAILAFAFAPHRGAVDVLTAWYGGILGKDNILTFALQMILILVTGYALASSAPVRRLLERLAASPASPRGAVALTFLVSSVACWLNWGVRARHCRTACSRNCKAHAHRLWLACRGRVQRLFDLG
jgi:short-chain fatty acids transporter